MKSFALIVAFALLAALAFMGIFALPDPLEDYFMLGAMMAAVIGYAILAVRMPGATAPARD